MQEYGRIIVVNLIDKKKDQLMIGEEYERACMKLYWFWVILRITVSDPSKLDFIWFDFHSECKKMHYENLEKLEKLTEASVTAGE